MRKYFCSLLLLLLPLLAMADSYNQHWKNVEQAQKKDQPKTVLKHLATIADKAMADREWGHLLKAELQSVQTQEIITPDSLLPQLVRFEGKAEKAEGVDRVLAAVYDCVLGKVYSDLSQSSSFAGKAGVMSADSCKARSRSYFSRALRDLDLLAQNKAGGYEPLLVSGSDSRIFQNDLLHVVCFEAEEYNLAAAYYKQHENAAAAMMSAFYQIEKDHKDDVREIHKSKYLARLDSLINEYQYLPETGEVAIAKFNFMDEATDISAKEKIDYIEQALRQWPTWPRMAILKNARSRITLPSFHVQMPETIAIPDRPIKVNITSLINIGRINMAVTKLKMSGAEDFNPQVEKDMKMIRSLMSDKPLFTDSRDYYGLPDYKEVRDTMQIPPLPVGVYLVEFTTSNKDVPAERCLLHVSNLRLLDMDMPDKQVRLIAVNATTGKPVGGAKIILQFRQWKNGRQNTSEEILTTEQNGEVTFSSAATPYRFRITTQSDKAMPWSQISTHWNDKKTPAANYKPTRNIQIYTDRAIYRPKQLVQASLLAYQSNYYTGESEVLKNARMEVKLRDANGQTIDTLNVETNEWGVASAEFNLPEVEKTGWFTIVATAKDGQQFSGTRHLRVEEYKRPTFVVSIDDYDRAYKAGDTISVKGWAKTYAGVPVQNARVEYHATTRTANWWRRYVSEATPSTETFADETTTAEDGSFVMRLPIVLTETSGPLRMSFSECGISATVTSLAGESRDGARYFPVSQNPTALLLDGFAEKQCLEQLSDVTFRYINNSGAEVASELVYRIDEGKAVSVNANERLRLDFEELEKGAHTLRAFCQGDSLEQKFVLFSLDDERPVIDTDAWYYDTPGSYDNSFNFIEGEPIRTQIGTSRDDQTVFYAIISDNEILEEGSLTLSNQNLNRSFIYKEEWGDGIALRYSWARNGKVYTFSERLHKPEKKTDLQLEWKTFRNKLVPGQKEEWTIRVLDADGKKAAAHMTATLYDKSLDQITPHSFSLNLSRYSFTPQIFTSQKNLSSQTFLYGEQSFRPLQEPSLAFSSFDVPVLGNVPRDLFVRGMGTVMFAAKSTGTTNGLAVEETVADLADAKLASPNLSAGSADAVADEQEIADDFSDVKIRENLNETAAFLPQLLTDNDGNISIRFTLPESLTTWRFIGLAHDELLNNGIITAEAIAQKQLMIQPNIPRFLREGDSSAIAATITNTTDNALAGTATLQLLYAATEKVAYQSKADFNVAANNTMAVSFDIPQTLAPEMFICKIVAKTKTASDGEQQYLPVLSRRELITTTRAITQTAKGKKTILLDELFGRNTSQERLSIEYTNNPAWLMVDALPAAVKDCNDDDNAVKFSTAIYAATLARELNIGLATDSLNTRIAALAERLTRLQGSDGSFSWYPGMPANAWITLEVVRNLVRLDNMLGTQSITANVTHKAMQYLASEISSEVKALKKREAKGEKDLMPSELAMDYLYVQAIAGDAAHSDRSDVSYLFGLLKDSSARLSIYGKANLAVAFALTSAGASKTTAAELVESAMQYSVHTEEAGRYFDTPKALLSWRNYTIPTETAVIEALQTLRPDDQQTIAEMRQWLLNEKRTQLWDTPLNTASAIYAFLNGNLSALDDVKAPAVIHLDGKTLQTSGKERGHFKTEQSGRHKKVVFDKRQDGMSFGAVTTYALQPTADVEETNANQLHVERQIVGPSEKMKVGDKVTVRIILRADRDMDFVEIEDNRAACFEPVSQVSGYRNGTFVTPRDTKTCYYINHVAKGHPVVLETEYFIDRKGEFQTGLLNARCAYAPEFTARAKAIAINVE